MILANLSIPMLGLVDTAILGHLPDSRYLSAVALGSSLLAFTYWAFGFLRMGTTGASAQSEGEEASALLVKALCLGLVIGVMVAGSAPALRSWGLTLMNAPANLHGLAAEYLSVRLLSAPAVMATYAAVGWLTGQQNTRAALYIAVTTNSLNIVLDLVFIVALNMNSRGAAIASAVSEVGGLLLAGYFLRHSLRVGLALGLRRCLTLGISLHRFLGSNFHLFIRTTALLFSFSFFTAQGAALGETILAANALLLQLVLASAYGMDGFAHAAEALVGRAHANRDLREFKQASQLCWRWSLYCAVGASALLLFAKPLILSAMTSLPEVYGLASLYYPWLVVLPVLSASCYTLDGIFIGAMRTRAMQVSMLLCVFGVYLPLWALTQNWGNHGLWFAFACFNTCRGLTLAWAFRRLLREARWEAACK
ncbi:MATE family efflux transporter [Spongiibacter sp. KMU-166]|uniref:MATE family efflux transporter n=2 Tax=Spongiibacter thalassae TaxID=2721624 RepID=A0ABX1GIR8_9GAMM|nr:MATE family efflux transporter [Spongiibacter thalassae]